MGTPRIDRLERNLIINGGFDIWQRNTSFAGTAGGAQVYTADRWQWAGGTTATALTISRLSVNGQANLPANIDFAVRHAFTTAEASPQTGGSLGPWYKIEGYDIASVRD